MLPSEDDLPLYEWEISEIIFRLLPNSNSILTLVCNHNGSDIPSKILSDYDDTNSELAIFNLCSYSNRSYTQERMDYYQSTAPNPYPQGTFFIYIDNVTPALDSSVETEITFDTETIFYLYTETSAYPWGKGIYGKCRIKTTSVTIQYE